MQMQQPWLALALAHDMSFRNLITSPNTHSPISGGTTESTDRSGGYGSTSKDGSTYGAWVVMNTRDTYFNGPKNSDLVVDGILYNYIVSNHHGNGTPNITNGFDRTFGPQYHHLVGVPGTTLEDSRQDALQYAYPEWNADFYDSIAKHVPNYVPTSGRGSWKGNIRLPRDAKKPIAILAQNKVDFQDNVADTSYQYWADIDASTGAVQMPRVKAGTYRLTVYADGIFGQYTQDNIVVKAGKATLTKSEWNAESAGTELWCIHAGSQQWRVPPWICSRSYPSTAP